MFCIVLLSSSVSAALVACDKADGERIEAGEFDGRSIVATPRPRIGRIQVRRLPSQRKGAWQRKRVVLVFVVNLKTLRPRVAITPRFSLPIGQSSRTTSINCWTVLENKTELSIIPIQHHSQAWRTQHQHRLHQTPQHPPPTTRPITPGPPSSPS